jgi:hypothetical protein
MIPDDLLATLPDDPELAFVHLEKKFRDELNLDLSSSENNDAVIEAAYNQYINHTSAIAQELGLDILQDWQNSMKGIFHDVSDNSFLM